MTDLLEFLQRYGDIVVFVWVLIDQLGVPVPAVPMLLVVGALAGLGKMNVAAAIGVAAFASLIADLFWYYLGRRRGNGVLAWLCKITLEPDSCVRRTETIFLSRGVKALLIAKFLPGLNAVAAALAGIFGVGALRFVAYASAGGLAWAGSWAGLGYVFSDALEHVATRVSHVGASLVALLGVLLFVYVLGKFAQRRRFLRRLRIARITPDELKQQLDAGADVVVLDLRTTLDVEASPYMIPGALRVSAEELENQRTELPRERELVLYCT